MKRSFGLSVAAILAACAAPAFAETPPPPEAAKGEAAPYVMAAARSDLYEINSSKVALEKS
ncbi:hypothetical protein OKW76_04290 [Sphingomonas sp. S1-29]|uniref:hypothetical protein n=1 Tax=Sphingomonas sp. S1-29 TaxID=2991074 RepID=UPI00224063B7|nr:hypothetical protein [Sphingomonas sp. S1-29]UZK70272.1 hypothetical protein OKW76_04290 [Sphingomonas sp. S1-29]